MVNAASAEHVEKHPNSDSDGKQVGQLISEPEARTRSARDFGGASVIISIPATILIFMSVLRFSPALIKALGKHPFH